jgi:D-psicose/D-tagatose/L-ribulose 3-epimerase
MRFGINTFLFTSPFTNDSVRLFPQFKKWGFDTVEIAIEDISHIDPVFVRKALDENGLICGSVGAVMGPGRDLRGTAGEQDAAIQYLKGVIAVLPPLGCHTLIGPIYSSVGRAEAVTEAAYKTQWATVVSHLKILAPYAGQFNVKLAIEPLNRYETDFINTCEQALKLIHEVDHDALMLMLDTFHMNIEEKDPAKAIIKAGNKLRHLHACGCDRGTPGGDQINWNGIAAALKKINFSGDVVIESFTQDVKAIAKAASIWRSIEPSKDDIAVKGLKFLKASL